MLVGVAQARDVEFVADRPGDWMLHCHLPHHMMNQMSSNVGGMNRMGNTVSTGFDDQRAALAEGDAGDGMACRAKSRSNANAVPGFPQDAYMEGPAMAMDPMVEKPENYGLRPGWSGYMMGMMTFFGYCRRRNTTGDDAYEAGAKTE